MKCPSCGATNDQGATFCQACGVRLLDDEAATQQAEADANLPLPGTPAGASTDQPLDARGRFQQAMHSKQGDDVTEEQDIWDGCYSKKAMIGWWVAAAAITAVAPIVWAMFVKSKWGVLFAILVAGWVLLVAQYAYRRYSVHYYLTTQRFIHETGILWRRTDRIELLDIDDVTFKQGPVQRTMNVGTIHLSSSDATDPEIDLPGIEDVRDVAGMIDDLRRRERRRRGLHIEAV